MKLQEFLEEWNNTQPTVEVHSSGSTGSPKVMKVEKKRMLASAKMTCDFLGLQKGDSALLCMSLEHIGAKMVVVRSLERGLRIIEVPPCGHPLENLNEIPDFAAMVPMQVYNSLLVPDEKNKLQQIKHLIIGGGAVQEKLQKELQHFPNAVWSTYGMTETLSHIALRRLNGSTASEWYQPFNHVHIRINEESCLCITAPQICEKEIITNDIVKINSKGQFKILGRKDNIINSGGIKIQIEEVEKALGILETPQLAIGSYPDEKFGQIVILLTTTSLSDLQIRINSLPKYWQPKHVFHVETIPLTANGKIARKQVQLLINQKICNNETHL